MFGAVLAGFFVRYEFWLRSGGLESDYVAWARLHHFGGIAADYLRMADSMLAGDWSKLGLSYPPGYPAFLAALRRLGLPDVQQARLVQASIDALAALLAYHVIVRLAWGQVAGLVAAFGYALSPWWAQGSQFAMAEALIPAGMLAVLALSIRLGETRSWRPWSLAGIAAALLALLRADMQLLGPALAVFAFAYGGAERFRAALVVLGAWLAIFAIWGLTNLGVRGEFGLANRAQFYAFWSGLGEFPNEYGYQVSDDRAQRLLSQRGLGWHSPEAEAYWRTEYLRAWRERPRHVLTAIAYRWYKILVLVDYQQAPLERLLVLVRIGPYLMLGAVVMLLRAGDIRRALVVAGPAGYALSSLGFVYVEARYVRYASLSYLFALAFACWLVPRLVREQLPAGVRAGLAVLVAALAARDVSRLASDLLQLYQEGRATTISAAARFARDTWAPVTTGECGLVSWGPLVPEAVTSWSSTGVVVRANGPGHQAVGQGLPSPAAAVAVLARIEAESPAALALLSGSDQVLDLRDVPVEPGLSTVALAAAVAPQGMRLMVINTSMTGAPNRIAVRDLRCRYLCWPDGRSPSLGFVLGRASLARAYPLRSCAP